MNHAHTLQNNSLRTKSIDKSDAETMQLNKKKLLNSHPSVRNSVKVPIKDGQFFGNFISFNGLSEEKEHFAIGFGNWSEQEAPLVRIHSECLTGDMFYSTRCDCGKQLDEAIEKMANEGGVIIYLRQEGRGIGLYNKIDAYELQIQGFDTYEANRMLNLPDDMRSYICAAEMLQALNIKNVSLLSNNPKKSSELKQHGIDVKTKVRTGVFANKDNLIYLLAKSTFTSHSIALDKQTLEKLGCHHSCCNQHSSTTCN